MAGSTLFAPSLARQAPYSFRILTPYLASLLPGSTLESFYLLAFVSNVLSLFLLFQILRKFEFSTGLCLVGVALYAGIFWTLKFSFYSPAYIDYQTQLFLLLIVLLTLSRQYLILVPVLAVGALQKESLAAYGLFSAVHLLRTSRWRANRQSLLPVFSLAGAPAAVLLLLRLLIPVDNTYSSLSVPIDEIAKLADGGAWPLLAQATFSGLGLLPVILVVRVRDSLSFFAARVEWLVYLSISTFFLFGGEDKARLFLYALPLVVLLALQTIRTIKESNSRGRFWSWLFVALALHVFLGGYLTPIESFSDYLHRMVPEHSDGHYRQFLIRNSIAALAFLIFTFSMMRRERPTDAAAPPAGV